MPETRLLPRLATDSLRRDHRAFRQLLHRLESSGARDPEAKGKLFLLLVDRLAVHDCIEEGLFFPALEKNVAERDQVAVLKARENQAILKRLLEELAELGPEEKTYDAKIGILAEVIERHIQEIEDELFPLFNRLPRPIRTELARSLAEQEREWGDRQLD